MPLSVLMIVGARRGGINYIALFVPVLISLGVSLYSLRYQPIIDFMPYDNSTNLREAVLEQRAQLEKSAANVLIFKDKRSGESVEFDASNRALIQIEELNFKHNEEIISFNKEHLDSITKITEEHNDKLNAIYEEQQNVHRRR